MTDKYHPVTREELERHAYWFRVSVKELEWLRDAINKHNVDDTRVTQEGMITLEMQLNSILKGMYGADIVLSRPDPLALLEASMKRDLKNNEEFESTSYDMMLRQGDRRGYLKLIKQLRENPEAVRQRGFEEG